MTDATLSAEAETTLLRAGKGHTNHLPGTTRELPDHVVGRMRTVARFRCGNLGWDPVPAPEGEPITCANCKLIDRRRVGDGGS